MAKHMHRLITIEVLINQVFYVPMLAKKFTLTESNEYDNNKIEF